MVFVELPEVGDIIAVDDEISVVESVKAASDVYAPISGEVVEINEALEDDPEIINSDPYGAGWFFRIKPDNIADYEALMTADEYAKRAVISTLCADLRRYYIKVSLL